MEEATTEDAPAEEAPVEEKQKRAMFDDRRGGSDRRQQMLPMPQGLDRRRSDCRRSRYFESQPWWLRIKYAEELVSEKSLAEAMPAAEKKDKNQNEPHPHR